MKNIWNRLKYNSFLAFPFNNHFIICQVYYSHVLKYPTVQNQKSKALAQEKVRKIST